MNLAGEKELICACQVLFGYNLNVGPDFLKYLQPSGVKKAYRKRARETHPDMVAARSKTHNINATSFLEVQKAYENLSRYLTARQVESQSAATLRNKANRHNRFGDNNRFNNTKPRHRKNYGQTTGNTFTKEQSNQSRNSYPFRDGGTKSENSHRSQLPKHKLLLGQFLYHSGVISWRMMIKSLGWQMTQRPKIGEIAGHLGWLNDKDIKRITGNRRALELFGNIAVKLGLLNEFQVKVLLKIQRRRQRRLGDYFVNNGVLTAKELENLVKKCTEHNSKFAPN